MPYVQPSYTAQLPASSGCVQEFTYARVFGWQSCVNTVTDGGFHKYGKFAGHLLERESSVAGVKTMQVH